MNCAESTESSHSESPEISSEEATKKGLELLQDKFGSSSSSDSEQQQPSKKLSNSDNEKKQASFHYLTSTHPDFMPKNITIYKGTSITLLNLQTSEVTYLDENETSQTIIVNNGSSAYPTFAMILDDQKQVAFAIKLPTQEVERSIKSTAHKQAFTPNGKKPHNGYGLKHALLGVTFIALCVALAHRYNQLPDAFAKFLDNFCAQWDNLVVNHFTR
jgi:hypothetical protein